MKRIFEMLDLFYANKHLYEKLQVPDIQKRVKKRDILFIQHYLAGVAEQVDA